MTSLALRSSRLVSRERGQDRALLGVLFILLAGPRLVLVPFGGSSLRLEDLILAGLLLLVVARWAQITNYGYRATGVLILSVVTALSIALATVAGSINFLSGILYGARQLEYWVVFPLVWLAVRERGESFQRGLIRVLKWVTLIQVSVALLQVAGVLNLGFSKFALDRGAGLTAGPYELGALCAALACFWIARGEFALGAVASLGVLLSSSRISLLALVVGLAVVAVMFFRTSERQVKVRLNPRTVGGLLVLLAVVTATSTTALASIAGPLRDRVESTSLTSTWTYAGQYAAFVTPPENSAEYAEVAYASIADGVDFGLLGASGDTSNLVRFYRWQILLDSTDGPAEYLFGHGPSFAGPSVDGAFLRVFIEGGILGLAAWGLLFRRVSKGATAGFVGVVATFCVGALFIDVIFAMRPMILFWILAALSSPGVVRARPSNPASVDQSSRKKDMQ